MVFPYLPYNFAIVSKSLSFFFFLFFFSKLQMLFFRGQVVVPYFSRLSQEKCQNCRRYYFPALSTEGSHGFCGLDCRWLSTSTCLIMKLRFHIYAHITCICIHRHRHVLYTYVHTYMHTYMHACIYL